MPNQQVAIIGATGYTGSELVRILHNHPKVDIALITSESHAGKQFSEIHPFFKGIVDIVLKPSESLKDYELDLVFLALPHGISMDYVSKYANESFKIIDLSGDFRLNGPDIYEAWYGKSHSYPTGFEASAYGLPELFADQVEKARIIANPGCYPTSVLLGLAPLVQAGAIDLGPIIVDSKSGVTGTGVKAKAANHFPSVNDNFKAYGLKNHRHTIEIQEKLDKLSGQQTTVQFTPHLLPLDRGILSTIYVKPKDRRFNEERLSAIYQKFYDSSPFIRLLDTSPTLKGVRGTNFCDIHTTFDERTGQIIVLSAIDNLVKGAAGQAVQNMNILFQWEQSLGLQQIPLSP